MITDVAISKVPLVRYKEIDKKVGCKSMSTKEKSIMIPTLTESFKKTKEMIKWWMENSDAEGNIKITTEGIIKQKEKEFGKKLEFAN